MKRYKILIVEDENIPANYIKKVLVSHGHMVLGIARSEEEMISLVADGVPPDLVLMDVNICGLNDGIHAAKSLLEYSPLTSVIYLTAYHDEEILRRAEETRPIGFLVKPIQKETLLSTIRIGMNQRPKSTIQKQIKFQDDIVYDIEGRSINCSEQTIKLGIYEAKALTILAIQKDQYVSYEELIGRIWPEETKGYGALRTLLWRLKKKLPPSVMIDNLYNSGYKMSF